jgi:hypothetical protein
MGGNMVCTDWQALISARRAISAKGVHFKRSCIMRKLMLACAAFIMAVGFLAVLAPAQEPAPMPATVITSSEYVTTAPRAGLFGRFRARRGGVTTVIQPATQVQGVQVQGTQAQSGLQQAQFATQAVAAGSSAVPASAQPGTIFASEELVTTRGLFRKQRVTTVLQPVSQIQVVPPQSTSPQGQSGLQQAQFAGEQPVVQSPGSEPIARPVQVVPVQAAGTVVVPAQVTGAVIVPAPAPVVVVRRGLFVRIRERRGW